MRTYPDEYLDRWADVWIANNLRQMNILLEQFLQAPMEILESTRLKRSHLATLPYTDKELAEPALPLLPAQRTVLEQSIETEIADELEAVRPTGPDPVVCRNGRLIEPLHHHKRPERRLNRCWFRGARA